MLQSYFSLPRRIKFISLTYSAYNRIVPVICDTTSAKKKYAAVLSSKPK